MEYNTETIGPREARTPAPSGENLINKKEPRNLISRLHDRRHELHRELQRLENTILVLERNANIVEIVEVVLIAQTKAEPRY